MASALTASLSDILDMNHCWHVSHCTWHPASRWPCAALAALGDFGLASGLLLRPLAAIFFCIPSMCASISLIFVCPPMSAVLVVAPPKTGVETLYVSQKQTLR